jgi:cellulose synthase/poly-beta-1,6-N-acetylglucosamine synthase-like glycosyltransferase
MSNVAEIAFWIAVLTVLYAYAGFPVFLGLLALVRHRPVPRRPDRPTVSVIIAAYNEEDSIAARIHNALSVDYPHEDLEIIVVSDGSEDATERIVESIGDRRVRLLSVPRRGKIYALNDAVAIAAGEILVFSDANTMFAPDAVRKLVRNFATAEIGGVAGRKIYSPARDGDSCTGGERAYWSYDTILKQLETRIGSTVSADGAIYAIRRDHYRPLTDAAVTDDFAISTAVIEQGARLVFDPEAIAYEATVPTSGQEFRRKVRLMTRGLRSVLLRRRLLNPFAYGVYSIVLFSHKVLRRLVPLLLICLLLSSAMAAREPFYLAAVAMQVLFYALALAGMLLRRTRIGHARFLSLPFYYCLANLSALIALGRVLSGHRVERWQPQRHATES